MVLEGGDIRRAGPFAIPGDHLYAIKSQPRAAVLQEKMNRVRAWLAEKRLPRHINFLLEGHSLSRGGSSLPYQGRLSESSLYCLSPTAHTLVLHGGFDPSRLARLVLPAGSPSLY